MANSMVRGSCPFQLVKPSKYYKDSLDVTSIWVKEC